MVWPRRAAGAQPNLAPDPIEPGVAGVPVAAQHAGVVLAEQAFDDLAAPAGRDVKDGNQLRDDHLQPLRPAWGQRVSSALAAAAWGSVACTAATGAASAVAVSWQSRFKLPTDRGTSSSVPHASAA